MVLQLVKQGKVIDTFRKGISYEDANEIVKVFNKSVNNHPNYIIELKQTKA